MSQIIKYPLSTEKSLKIMEAENRLIFIVDLKASKPEIKKEFEEMFKVKVIKVNTSIQKGRKKAYIKLAPNNPAIDIATQLGMM